MRTVLLGALVLLTAACGVYRFPGGSQPGTGSVTGTVVALPCTPVEAAGVACAGRPVANLEIDFIGGDSSVAATTDSNGKFAADLPAGIYKISLRTRLRVLTGPASVDVQAGASAVADFVLDSGIRIPVPLPVPVPAPLPPEPALPQQ